MRAWGNTDIGTVRKQNQDTFRISPLEDAVLAVVCDGMGGAQAGNIASAVAVDTFTEAFTGRMSAEGADSAVGAMLQAVELANTGVYKRAQSGLEYVGMGTTLVAVYAVGGEAIVANVGDSRAYLLSCGELRRVTKDHSVVEALVTRGDITPEEAKVHPNRNLITRAVGTEETVQCDVFEIAVKPGDCMLLCSDGLSNVLRPEELKAELGGGNRESCCDRLIELARRRGAPDNVTAVVLEI